MSIILIGDVGGTNSRLRLLKLHFDRTEVIKAETFPSQNYSSIIEIVQAFLVDQPIPRVAVLGIAGAVLADTFNITNVAWPITSVADMKQATGMTHVKFLNDFEAAGYGILDLTPEDLIHLNPGTLIDPSAPKSVIGPGTGLGECFLTPYGDGLYKVWPSEGGHCDFGPKNELEWRYAKYIMSLVEPEDSPYNSFKPIQQITYELALGGIVLPNIYYFFRAEHPELIDPAFEAEYEAPGANKSKILMEKGLTGSDLLCKKSADLFLRFLGYECGNMIAKTICRGGLYILGGIVQKNAELISTHPAFIEGLHAKPRHIVDIIDQVPIFIVKQRGEVGLLGAQLYSKKYLKRLAHY